MTQFSLFIATLFLSLGLPHPVSAMGTVEEAPHRPASPSPPPEGANLRRWVTIHEAEKVQAQRTLEDRAMQRMTALEGYAPATANAHERADFRLTCSAMTRDRRVAPALRYRIMLLYAKDLMADTRANIEDIFKLLRHIHKRPQARTADRISAYIKIGILHMRATPTHAPEFGKARVHFILAAETEEAPAFYRAQARHLLAEMDYKGWGCEGGTPDYETAYTGFDSVYKDPLIPQSLKDSALTYMRGAAQHLALGKTKD